jgi:hypothetical protein
MHEVLFARAAVKRSQGRPRADVPPTPAVAADALSGFAFNQAISRGGINLFPEGGIPRARTHSSFATWAARVLEPVEIYAKLASIPA